MPGFCVNQSGLTELDPENTPCCFKAKTLFFMDIMPLLVRERGLKYFHINVVVRTNPIMRSIEAHLMNSDRMRDPETKQEYSGIH